MTLSGTITRDRHEPAEDRMMAELELVDERLGIADDRDRLADERDRVADERDQIADERDRIVERRERAVESRGRLGLRGPSKRRRPSSTASRYA